MSNRFDRENAEIALNVLAKGKARTFEIRIPKAGRFGTISGYFNGFVALADALATLDKGEYEGCYITLNPVNPALLARASNQFKNWSQFTTNDADIARREWMLVDIDPQRPTGISSTNEEKAAAKKLAFEVRNWLREQGWAEPVACDSGNGFHLLYPIDLPNDELSRDMIRGCLEALADKFDTPTVHIDRKVYNAARIVKAYGSVARKGDSTDERPHRTARMFAPPEKLGEVTLVQLAAVADLTEKKRQPKKAMAADAEGRGLRTTCSTCSKPRAGSTVTRCRTRALRNTWASARATRSTRTSPCSSRTAWSTSSASTTPVPTSRRLSSSSRRRARTSKSRGSSPWTWTSSA